MKQKLLQSLMLIAALLTGTHAHAYDFTSDGIYYTIKSSTYNTIEVTYRYINYGSYSGDITNTSLDIDAFSLDASTASSNVAGVASCLNMFSSWL